MYFTRKNTFWIISNLFHFPSTEVSSKPARQSACMRRLPPAPPQGSHFRWLVVDVWIWCIYIYIHIYIYICEYILIENICLYTYICLYLFFVYRIYLYIYIDTGIYIFIYVLFRCVFIHIFGGNGIFSKYRC
jgi:hypothetical protein